ncbi:T-lymphocyte surface antigen Ly-9 isoform X1 [Notothenia coriiceps]|uniref:T-lymphocyte surface antigen Ly-9 isoform X1 n=1 Tax=Notothenia coriiceps TaxID=8208 RepID=A0A6I9Q422_9TELE|nr:PREDICTED: signaling lymphocytic activation molecule isoform X1 [Notothenia coriiceps]
MVGGCQSCFLTYISVLLLGCFLHDVEASNPQRAIHKKVGDTVELSSGFSTEGVTMADWKYDGLKIAGEDSALKNTQFDGRLKFNPYNLNLTLEGLTLKDSGKYSFISTKGIVQRPTVFITLHVHEPITKEPMVNSSSTWHTSNASCTVLMECSAATTGNVTYQWTVGTETFNGSRLQHIIRQQDEDTKFNCTISNVVSEMSTIKTVSCSNTTSQHPERGMCREVIVVYWCSLMIFYDLKLVIKITVHFTGITTPFVETGFFFALIVGAGGSLLVAVIVGVAVCVYRHKQSQARIDSNDLTVYADINDVAIEDKPCSLYETIDNRGNKVPPGPNTVYDKIQLNRLRNESVSPYQDIS